MTYSVHTEEILLPKGQIKMDLPANCQYWLSNIILLFYSVKTLDFITHTHNLILELVEILFKTLKFFPSIRPHKFLS